MNNPPQIQISRRQFLKTASAAALGAPLLSSCASYPTAKRAAPSERITLGFIGMGTQNRGLLHGFLGMKETQVLAVCEVDADRREHHRKLVEDAYAKQSPSGHYKGCAAYNDFRELIARRDVDAVVIATPDHWHTLQILAAARARKDIYCEKPLTLTIREARECITAVRRHGCVLQTGSQQRSSAEFRRAAELVRNGRLGKLTEIHVAIGGPSRWCDLPTQEKPEGLDWDLWLGPAPWRGYHEKLSPRGVHTHFPGWRDYREYSGGMMTDWGAHHFDIAQWALGMDQSGPVEIIPPDDPKAARGVRYRYANGVEMIHKDGNGITFLGTEGKIFVTRGKFEAAPESIAAPLDENALRLYKSDDHLRDWIKCIRTRQRPVCDVEIGARSVTVCHLGNLAYWNHRRLQWDPKNWRFIGDREANTWLDRERRRPWTL